MLLTQKQQYIQRCENLSVQDTLPITCQTLTLLKMKDNNIQFYILIHYYIGIRLPSEV